MNSPLEKRIHSSLEYQTEHLDTETLQRLQQIRREALMAKRASLPSLASILTLRTMVPAVGLAASVLFTLLVLLPQSPNEQPAIEQTAMLEWLENPEDLDNLTDPGFYLWLDEQQEADLESAEHHAV